MELKFRRRWSILLTIPKLTLAIPNMIFQKSFSLFKSGHCENQIRLLKHKTGQYLFCLARSNALFRLEPASWLPVVRQFDPGVV